MQTLRPFQDKAVELGVRWTQARLAPEYLAAHNTLCMTAPTGTGKGTIQLALLNRLRDLDIDAVIVTPSVEIIRGFLERAEVEGKNVRKLGVELGVMTPIKLANMIDAGEQMPEVVIVDECHEFVTRNKTPERLMLHLGSTPVIGFTATPYRGTNRGTADFLKLWGEPVELIGFREAIDEGYLSFPEFKIIPICDDDRVKIKNGEFDSADLTKTYQGRINNVCDLIVERMDAGDKIIVSLPGTEAVWTLHRALKKRGVTSFPVVNNTPDADRLEAYKRSQAGDGPLLQISVLTRGADLPGLRTLIDCQPTQSPVRWMQTIGRVMRPGPQSRVFVTNRNLERHAYLLEGMIPGGKIVESQEEFGSPSARSASRDLGLEGLERFKVLSLPLSGGGWASMHNLFTANEKGQVLELACVCLPGHAQGMWAKRHKRLRPGSTSNYEWEKWQMCQPPESVDGFASSTKRGSLSEKQQRFWERNAEHRGLDPAAKVSRREMDALFMLIDLRMKIPPLKEKC